MSARRRLAILPALLFLFWAFCLAATSLVAGPESYLRVDDNADCAIPARMAVAAEWRQGHNILWFPFADSGADRLGSNQACHVDMVFYLVFPPWLAHGLGLLAQRFVAGYFTFRLLKDQFAVSSLSALGSGLLYATFCQSTINQSATGFNYCAGLGSPGIPMFLWALSGLSQTRGALKLLVAAGLGGLLAATSIFAISLFFFPLWYLWILVVRKEQRLSYGLLALAFSCGWVAASAPMVWPTFLLAKSSHRSDLGATLAGASNAYQTLFKLLENNAIPLFVAVTGWFVSRGYTRRSLTIAMALMALFLTIGTFEKTIIPSLDRAIGIGFVRGMNFKRFFEAVPFLAAFSMGLSLEALRGAISSTNAVPPNRSKLGVAALAICLVWTLAVAGRSIRLQIMAWSRGEAYAALLEIEQLQALRKQIANEPPGRLATVVTLDEFDDNYRLFPGFMPAYGLECADGYLNIFPKRYLNYWSELLRGAAAKNTRIANYSGNRLQLWFPFSPDEWNNQAKDSRPVFGELYNLNLLSAANVRYIVSSVPLNDSHLEAVSESQSLREPQFSLAKLLHPVDYLREYERARRIFIYRNRACLPRCYVVSRSVSLSSPAEVLNAMTEASPDDLRSKVFLEGEPSSPDQSTATNATTPVEITQYAADEIHLQVNMKAKGYLVMAVSANPYWQAEIDGSAAKVRTANAAFMAIEITVGQHQVRWRYKPPWAF